MTGEARCPSRLLFSRNGKIGTRAKCCLPAGHDAGKRHHNGTLQWTDEQAERNNDKYDPGDPCGISCGCGSGNCLLRP